MSRGSDTYYRPAATRRLHRTGYLTVFATKTLLALGVVLLVAACGGGSDDGSIDVDATGTDNASTGSAPRTLSTTSPVPESAASVVELVSAEWSEFCALDPSLLYGPDTDALSVLPMEAALATGGTPVSDDAADLLASLRSMTEARAALGDAIEDAKASQTVVDCTTNRCDLLIGEQGVLLLDDDAFKYESGIILPLPVDEQLGTFYQATRDLATRAQGFGLDDCVLLTGADN